MHPLLRFQTCGHLIFGPGAVRELESLARARGIDAALVVTTQGLPATGVLAPVQEQLDKAGVRTALFDDVEPDPSSETATRAAEAAARINARWILGVGGGSALDIAKVVAVLRTNPGDPLAFAGIGKVPKPGLPTLVIPTTAGTGSETTPIAVLSDKKAQLKKGVVSEYLYPTVALVDPALAVTLPPLVTAYTGMDTLTHAIEAFINKNAHPLVDSFALEAIRLTARHLRRAVACGDDLDARSGMALASLLGGMCLGPVNTAAVHALAYPLGGTFNVPHGLANALLLPFVMEFTLPGAVEKFAAIAEALGERTELSSTREAAAAAVRAVRTLAIDLGMKRSLRDVDIPESAIDPMAKAAMEVTRLLNNNPRRVTEADARAIYRAAFNGF